MAELSVSVTIAVAAPAAASPVLTTAQPSGLLTIDQNRTTVLDRIVANWGHAGAVRLLPDRHFRD